MTENLYKRLSEKRKELQEQGLVPDWYTTAGFQMFVEKYEHGTNGRSVKGQFERIAKVAASYVKDQYPQAEDKFFELLWKGWLSPSSPVLGNTGTNKGFSVSCSGGIIGDSINDFYSTLHETAMLTKTGFGTSAYLGDIRSRGSQIAAGGKASGVMPVVKLYVQTMRDVAQGTARRGAWAGYLPVMHADFDELADYTLEEPDDVNIGWIINDAFVAACNNGDKEALRRFKKMLKLKMVTGRGYFCFIDKVNRHRPKAYVDNKLFVKASNLCQEITLFADDEHTYTCVLSSMNVSKFDEWKDTDAVFWATIFLDCIAEDFITKATGTPGMQKAILFTKKGRALGLGQCGFHTYLQAKLIDPESFEAHCLSQDIAKHIFTESLKASQNMAATLGEPEWCKGLGVRNTHRIAIAPTKSTALLMGGISEGINNDPAMVYSQDTSAGTVERINPELLKLMKAKGVYSKKTIKDITTKLGSVQHVDWLNDKEKAAFKTAFEENQKTVTRRAAARGRYVDQWQSVNYFFGADEDEAWIAEVHSEAFNNESFLGSYYIYTQAGVTGAKGECIACQ